VLDCLLVLPLCERVDRPKLLAAPRKALHASLQLKPLVLAERRVGGRRIEAEPARDALELGALLGRPVSHLLSPHLGGRYGLRRLLQPLLETGLLLRARA
jgi:hypothetical protein